MSQSYIEKLKITKDEFLSALGDVRDPQKLWEILVEAGYVKKKRLGDDNEGMFLKVWLAVRKKFKLGSPKSIPRSQLEEATYEAMAFAKEFDLDLRIGMVAYCTIAAEQFEAHQLYRLPFFSDKISHFYSVHQEVLKDPNKGLTDKLIDLYDYHRVERFGEHWWPDSPQDRLHFVRLAGILKKKRINPEEYMHEIFDRYDWLGKPFSLTALTKVSDDNTDSTREPVKVRRVTLKRGADRYD